LVLMESTEERDIWANAPGIDCIDLVAEMAREVGAYKERLAKRAKEIERNIGLPLYKSASSYLLYRRFAIDYFGAYDHDYSERRILEDYVGAYGVMSRLIDEYHPSLIVHEALDRILTLVTLALAYHHGIFNIGMIFASGVKSGSIYFYYGLQRENFLCTYLLRKPGLIREESRREARAMITRARQERLPVFSHVEARRELLNQSPLRHPGRLIRRLVETSLWRNPGLAVQRWLNWRWLQHNLHRDIPEEPFILFLMHYQPEASTTSQSPRWVDQDRLIEQMVVNAPQGIKIVIKENPLCYGWRGKRYFGLLAKFTNVHLSHPLVDTQELLRRAAALVTITGSSGFEAILLGTRVAVLGRPAYSVFQGVRKLDWPEQIFEALADPAWRPEAYEVELETFVAAFIQSVHALGDVEPGRKWPAPKTAGPNFAAALRRTLAFIEDNGLTPQDFDPGLRLAEPTKPARPRRRRKVATSRQKP
jgi:hypothetical protein